MIEFVHMIKNCKFENTMLNARLCDYGDAYILFEGRITC